MITDMINAAFEFGGSVTIWMNSWRVIKDQGHAGMSVASVCFMAVWGLWNLAYYPSLQQWWSFGAGCSITLANIVWIVLLLKYGKKK